MENQREKLIIGRREHISFPELGLTNITAKMDTGAYTSALYCHEVREENGVLIFRLLHPSHPAYDPREHRFTEYGQKKIKNSFGFIEKRYTIKTLVKIGKRQINSVFSLTDRSDMRYPVLIGRKILKKRFIIDVTLVNTLSSSKKA
ncbi:MAG TPA: RimK/LysX family protein [Bacteroidia bacterium]|nr:RimK/LysX family protein [Bacteroidia bacterium]